MDLQAGKNIEKYLIGQVKMPISEREWQRIAFEKGHGSAENGIRVIRENLRKSLALSSSMEEVRNNQEYYVDENGKRRESDPATPHRKFANRLLLDLGSAVEEEIGGEDSRYEPRFFTASGSELDMGGSFDFWVELFDKETGKTIADYKVDIKTLPNQEPRNLADATYYFDPKYIKENEKGHDTLDRAVYRDSNYTQLVKKASDSLMKQYKKFQLSQPMGHD